MGLLAKPYNLRVIVGIESCRRSRCRQVPQTLVDGQELIAVHDGTPRSCELTFAAAWAMSPEEFFWRRAAR